MFKQYRHQACKSLNMRLTRRATLCPENPHAPDADPAFDHRLHPGGRCRGGGFGGRNWQPLAIAGGGAVGLVAWLAGGVDCGKTPQLISL